ncbi:penicillin-binding protein [Polaribacter sp. ALD11]|uniref:type IX secretion system protein PorQ n=1 Tax=Polaribacter sp. ALD11 TaxID=2058137 RepID=UPI000C310333|nr:type IX secretion system protein PorQ [Polaribacter sp. ALD11]AUC83799.1 penicillin-binding protein [Polaribacter sp. ALD11]
MTKLFFISILFFSISLNAQVGGERIYQFLNVSTSARQVALGGEVLTLIDDINQPIWNPSTINSDLDRRLSVNYSSYLAGINVGSISYAREISRRFGTVHASIKYLDYGTIIGADEEGVEIGNFKASDIAVSVGYAYNLPNTNFYLGANLKLITSNISNFSSTGIATDIALLYQSPFKPFSFTLVARNIGTQISTFNGLTEKLPLEVALGGSYKLEHVPLKWYGTLDNLQQWDISVANPSDQTTDLEGNVSQEGVGFIGNTLRHFVLGAELFPESLINVRLGYNFRRAAELKLQNARTFSGISFGFGIKMNRFKFNYAHSKFHSASNVSTFSLEIDLDNRRY